MKNFIKENWFKIGILVILFCSILVFSQTSRDTVPKTLVVTNKFATSTGNVQTNNDTQNICKQKADNFLKSQPAGYSIQSHYNEDSSICFFVIQNESNDMITMQFLYSEDGEQLGYYTRMISTGDSMLCDPLVTDKTSLQPTSAKLRCTSIATYASWQNFIKPYMSN